MRPTTPTRIALGLGVALASGLSLHASVACAQDVTLTDGGVVIIDGIGGFTIDDAGVVLIDGTPGITLTDGGVVLIDGMGGVTVNDAGVVVVQEDGGVPITDGGVVVVDGNGIVPEDAGVDASGPRPVQGGGGFVFPDGGDDGSMNDFAPPQSTSICTVARVPSGSATSAWLAACAGLTLAVRRVRRRSTPA